MFATRGTCSEAILFYSQVPFHTEKFALFCLYEKFTSRLTGLPACFSGIPKQMQIPCCLNGISACFSRIPIQMQILQTSIGTSPYKLAKLLRQVLTLSTANEYTVTDSFYFAEEICQQDPNLHMASLDVDSLFTNISLGENIDICIDNLYNGNENPPNIPKHDYIVICLT